MVRGTSSTGGATPRCSSTALASDLDAGRHFRAVLRGVGEAWGLSPQVRQVALLLGSELVNNAIIHGRAPVQVDINLDDDLLHLAVSDASTSHPVIRPHSVIASGGRGLQLMTQLSRSWGVDDGCDGKTVWCCLLARP